MRDISYSGLQLRILDMNGDDINAGTNFNMLAIQSRISLALSGPDALGAKTSGLIEGDFFAQANDNIDLVPAPARLRKTKLDPF